MKDLTNMEAYNLPHILRTAAEWYGKSESVVITNEQEVMLKDSYPDKKVPIDVPYTKKI